MAGGMLKKQSQRNPDILSEYRTTMLLRPRREESKLQKEARTATIQHPKKDTYRLWHPAKTEMFNDAVKQHRAFKPKCSGDLLIDEDGEVKRGLVWKERLKCNKCTYVSYTHKLYKEVESKRCGPKQGAANLALQSGLAHTSISGTGLTKLMLATNTPAPSMSGMQKSANKMRDILKKSNEASMKRIKENLKVAGQVTGQDTPKIPVQIDCRYNNPTYAGIGNTPFQAATQVTQLTAEDVTAQKFIITSTVKNKLCRVCSSSDKDVAPHDCSSNLAARASIRNERQWTRESLQTFHNSGIEVDTIISDPDSSTFRAAEDLFLEGESSTPPLHQLDTRHVSALQRKLIKEKIFSKEMIPGRTSNSRKANQGYFAIDLASRCQAEHQEAMKACAGDTVKVNIKMQHTKHAIKECYQGRHHLCKKHSFVCKGRKVKNWLSNSSRLSKTFLIKPNGGDMRILDECINMLKKTKYLHNTQKVESVNRTISAHNPRNVTFARNVEGRIHKAIQCANEGTGQSILLSCEAAGAPLTSGSRVTRALAALQKANDDRKDYKRSRKAITARNAKRRRLYKLHRENRDNTLEPAN